MRDTLAEPSRPKECSGSARTGVAHDRSRVGAQQRSDNPGGRRRARDRLFTRAARIRHDQRGGRQGHRRVVDVERRSRADALFTGQQSTPRISQRSKTAWVWDGASFNAHSGRCNAVVHERQALSPSRASGATSSPSTPMTGETIWSYREPNTGRYEYSMRKDYGKGVAYAEIDGRRRRLHHEPGVLFDGARCRNRRAARGFRQTGPDRRISEDRRRRSARGSRPRVRSLQGHRRSRRATSPRPRRRSSSTAS